MTETLTLNKRNSDGESSQSQTEEEQEEKEEKEGLPAGDENHNTESKDEDHSKKATYEKENDSIECGAPAVMSRKSLIKHFKSLKKDNSYITVGLVSRIYTKSIFECVFFETVLYIFKTFAYHF